MAKEIKFNIKLNIDGKQVVVDCKNNVKQLGEALTGVSAKARNARETLTRLSAASTLMRNGMDGIRQLGAAMQPFIDKANAATEAQTKLTTVMRQRMSASDADVAAVNKLVAAQTQLGVVGGTVQRSGLQQLATFASQRQTLETLLPAMNNLLAQQKGLKATSEDAVGVANLMGKALMGNVGALTRVGVTLTDHQKELIKTGDEYTKATTLAQAITDNVGNMNAELAKTDAGQVKQMANSFGSLQVKVGKFFSEYQNVIAGFGQLGMAVTAVGTLGTAFTGLVRAIGITSAATSLWQARSVMSTAVTNLFTAALNGASVGATTLKFALRGLMSATVIGAAITLLGIGLEKLINYFTSASDGAQKMGSAMQSVGQSFQQQRDQALAPTLTKYQELQAKWKTLKSEHEKNSFIKANKTAFEQLGVSINGVGQAEDFFVRNTKAVQDAMYARAEAAAAASMAEEEMRKALEAESKVKHDRLMDKDSYKKQHHTGKAGHDAALDALVDTGAIKLTSKRTRRDEAKKKMHQANARNLSNRSRAATNRANRGLGRYQGGTVASTQGTRSTGSTGGRTRSGSTATEKKALMGSLDWYDQKMQELRKKIYASNNEATAQGFQAQYEDLEQKSKNLKVAIGLEEPEAKDVKTYVQTLQERLAAAQRQMDNATTISARVTASAKVDEIQAEIDKATKGELSIEADVEPTYVQRGSLADKRQSYQNAQGKASRIQEDFEIGIIGKEEAERQIDEINEKIKALGVNMKPIKLEVDNKGLDALKSIGSIDVTNFDSIVSGLQSIKDISGSTAKGLATASAACVTMGSSLQQLGSDSGAAKAGMIMSALGQIVLSYATAMASAAKTGWISWLAFGLTGAAQLASIVATIKGFATGGIVGGNSTTGDKVPIRVNSGEMVLNKGQQARLFAMANGQMNPAISLPSASLNTATPRLASLQADSGDTTVRFVLQGDTLVGAVSNRSRLMNKVGKRTNIVL